METSFLFGFEIIKKIMSLPHEAIRFLNLTDYTSRYENFTKDMSIRMFYI